MAVPTFEPQISVVLMKNIGRATVSGSIAASQRFQGASNTVDLTPYLGETSSVVVHKSVRDSAGMFSITLSDEFDDNLQDSLYGAAEPMDIVEIRMARDTSKYFSGAYTNHMPIMMRGFVTDVRRTEMMTERGPQRVVMLSGQDYGKILLATRIAYLPNMVTGQDLLSAFKLFVNYGVDSTAEQDASAFVQGIMTSVVQKFIDGMRAASTTGTSPVMDIQVEATVQSAQISPFGVNQWPGGTIYDLLKYYGDVGPFNELYIEDREDSPYLVYRPTPFKDPTGEFIQTMSNPPLVTVVTDVEVVTLSTGRSDAALFNYYWVDMPNFSLVDGKILQVAAAQAGSSSDTGPYIQDYPNCDPKLYGFRNLEVATQQGPRIDGKVETSYDQMGTVGTDFVAQKRLVIIKNNRDNVVFEDGTMDVRGNEAIKAGTYVSLTRGADDEASGGLTSEMYAHTVTHTFLPFRSFRTSVDFDRGTGFIVRTQADGGSSSPYLTELSNGGVYA